MMDAGAVAFSPVVDFTGPAGVVDASAVASSPVVSLAGVAGVVDARCSCLFSCGCLHRSCRSGGCRCSYLFCDFFGRSSRSG